MNHVITDQPEHVPFTNNFRDNLATMAARLGKIGVTLALLEAAGVSDARNGDGQTVLHVACVTGRVTLANALFDQPPRARDERGGWRGIARAGSDPNLTDAVGYTPLMIAVARRDVAMVKLFMRYASDYTDSHPVADGQPQRVVCNLRKFVDVLGSTYYGRTALHIVCATIPEYSPTPWTGDGPDTRSVEIIRALCTHDQTVANYIADAIMSPLEVACLAGRVVDAVSLITCGANPFLEIDDRNGRATLEEAITTVARGAATSSGARLFEVYSAWARTTPEWSSAREWITKYDKETAETAAALATSGSAEDIARALADLPQVIKLSNSMHNTTDLYYSLFYRNGLALINAQIYSNYDGIVGTILSRAARNSDLKVVRALIANGADVNLGVTRTSHTPLMVAAENRRTVVISDLIRAGANVNAVDNTGSTALHNAVDQYNGHGQRVAIEPEFTDEHNAGREIADDDDAISVECIRLLCAAGANVDAALIFKRDDYTGVTTLAHTPFTLAVNHGDTVIIQALLECGANPQQNVVLDREYSRERYEGTVARVVTDMGGLEGVRARYMTWLGTLPQDGPAWDRYRKSVPGYGVKAVRPVNPQ
jgi:ankyrin repeat protein